MSSEPIRALGLLSGGLDSILASRLLLEQGLQVEGVNFSTGFCIQAHTGSLRNPEEGVAPPRNDALHAARLLGIRLHLVDIAEDYVRIVTNPRHGYGKNLNPCLDCKIFMVQKAWEMAREMGFHFIFTGEVVGQRPMSQRRANLPFIQKHSGAGEWLLRPLCAKRLLPTEPELRGWVDRELLGALHGRGRYGQFEMARRFGITDFPAPAGGCCFLTDPVYSRRLGDLWQGRGVRDYSMEDILILKAGRHLRPAPHFKVIVGRDETENAFLEGFRNGRFALNATEFPGPLALVEGQPTEADLELACRLTARFGKGKNEARVTVAIRGKEGETERSVTPLLPEEIPEAWYI
ncbi:MAG: tRNA (5-methylaminomethyl-2-thiouridylate)-methyltransferase [Magnetococcales bacterium]|nr:tRNA (5-methylaminomethyl-2-thiouridylate)-methyltransferase [Magnetococcales bacterium]